MSIRPIGAQVLVRSLPSDKISTGGIVIPETARGRDKEVALYGEVVGVGNGHRVSGEALVLHQIYHVEMNQRFIPLDVQVGDRVIYGNWLGQEVVIEGVKHQLIHEEHVLAVIDA